MNINHIIPDNTSTIPHINSPTCWCLPTFIHLTEETGEWRHRGEILNGDIESTHMRHNLMEDRKWGQ